MKRYTYIINYEQFKNFDSYKLDKITRVSIGSKFLENTFSSNYETGRIKNSKKCCKCLIF